MWKVKELNNDDVDDDNSATFYLYLCFTFAGNSFVGPFQSFFALFVELLSLLKQIKSDRPKYSKLWVWSLISLISNQKASIHLLDVSIETNLPLNSNVCSKETFMFWYTFIVFDGCSNWIFICVSSYAYRTRTRTHTHIGLQYNICLSAEFGKSFTVAIKQ